MIFFIEMYPYRFLIFLALRLLIFSLCFEITYCTEGISPPADDFALLWDDLSPPVGHQSPPTLPSSSLVKERVITIYSSGVIVQDSHGLTSGKVGGFELSTENGSIHRTVDNIIDTAGNLSRMGKSLSNSLANIAHAVDYKIYCYTQEILGESRDVPLDNRTLGSISEEYPVPERPLFEKDSPCEKELIPIPEKPPFDKDPPFKELPPCEEELIPIPKWPFIVEPEDL
jgi:hypothetical protein